MGFCKRLSGPAYDRVHGPGRKFRAEELAQKLDGVTAGDAVTDRECGHGRLQAAVATLAVRNRVSRRDTVELLRELFGAELATGTVDAIIRRAGEALAESHDELLRCVRGAR